MTNAENIVILNVWSKKAKSKRKERSHLYSLYEDMVSQARDEAVLAGENARLRIEIEEAGADSVRESVRRRLARTLVQLGMRIDPLAGEDASEEE